MKLIKLSIIILALGFAVQGCGNKAEEQVKEKGTSVVSQKIVPVTVEKTYSYSGTVTSLKKSTLSTRIMGQINQVLVNEGDAVKKGQLLISLRSNDINAQKSQAEANILATKAAFTNAENDLNRIKSLFESKSATQKELDDITTHYKMTKAQYTAAQKAKVQVEEMLAYANIRAPYNGVITDKFVDSGDMANPGMPLVAIESPGKFEVTTRIPESEVNMVEKDDAVEVNIKNSTEMIKGKVTHISPSSRFSGSQFEARILLMPNENQKESIRSGMFANISLKKGTESRILIDNNHLVNKGQLTGVWTISQTGTALLRWVQTGKRINGQTEIISGLSEGDELIIKTEVRLFDGLLVNAK
ncbi:efflux RND transporter periplasmic adaptor subunit [Plebeiibacterium marinum]|uniref:Sporulation protein YqfD n=1 Tax=Plebeiibacterium marinum TaxID=2992111 RepID=A0AAE3ME59_9BACT|nr:sporulation protein YqfD [Plebeiobacterium marinum]MCW3805941.1 sporulation protein YqfD [Plebeiobacterium marinum]